MCRPNRVLHQGIRTQIGKAVLIVEMADQKKRIPIRGKVLGDTRIGPIIVVGRQINIL